ncbi:MAG: choice-of-anchor V domain-containing protein [Blastocatellia bacterium]
MSKTDKVKVCLLALAIIGITFILTGSRAINRSFAFAEGPVAARTGGPGELTCDTSGCHNSFALNSGSGQFTIEAPATYQPGQSYQITVHEVTSDTTRRRWGFQLTALTKKKAQAGNLMATSTTQILTDNSLGKTRQYIEHNLQGTFEGLIGGTSWTFTWVAPSSNIGAVTMYAAGNMANGDGTPNGDFIYTTSTVIGPAAPGPPSISSVTISGKNMVVDGMNFDSGSVILVNGSAVNTLESTTSPATELIGKKAGKKIVAGQTVTVQVKNSDGTESNMFMFTRSS